MVRKDAYDYAKIKGVGNQRVCDRSECPHSSEYEALLFCQCLFFLEVFNLNLEENILMILFSSAKGRKVGCNEHTMMYFGSVCSLHTRFMFASDWYSFQGSEIEIFIVKIFDTIHDKIWRYSGVV